MESETFRDIFGSKNLFAFVTHQLQFSSEMQISLFHLCFDALGI